MKDGQIFHQISGSQCGLTRRQTSSVASSSNTNINNCGNTVRKGYYWPAVAIYHQYISSTNFMSLCGPISFVVKAWLSAPLKQIKNTWCQLHFLSCFLHFNYHARYFHIFWNATLFFKISMTGTYWYFQSTIKLLVDIFWFF